MRFLLIILFTFQTIALLAQQNENQLNQKDTFYIDTNQYYSKSLFKGTEILVGGSVNWLSGGAGEHLGIGGGFKADVLGIMQRHSGIGFTFGIYANPLKKKFNLATERNQEDVIPTIFTGIAFTNRVFKFEKSEFTAQLELNIAFQNIVSSTTDNSDDYIQFTGFSPGIMFNYLVGGEKSKNPLKKNYLNLYVGIRPLFFDYAAASGTMFEVGIAWRNRNYSPN